MSSRRGRTQKAGYIYLRNTKRGAWLNSVLPYGNQVVSQLSAINWKSFRYHGPIECKREQIETQSTKFGQVKIVDDVFTGTATTVERPYEVFGGAACELWAKQFPNLRFRELVDPTGDIDVFIANPDVIPDSDPEGVYDSPDLYLFKDETGLTELGDQYSRWLFNEVVRVYSPLAKFFDSPKFALPNKDETRETSRADIAEPYGNLLFTRIASAEMANIKVQISIKSVSESATVVNHLIEFIMTKTGMSRNLSPFVVQSIHVASPWELFSQQIQGLADRGQAVLEFWDKKPIKRGKPQLTPLFYKLDNHCGRILFLALLLKQTQGKSWPLAGKGPKVWFQPVTSHTLLSQVKPLYTTKTYPMCNYTFPDFMKLVFETFEGIPGIPPGTFTNKDSPYRQELESHLYTARGGYRRIRNVKTLKKRRGASAEIQ